MIRTVYATFCGFVFPSATIHIYVIYPDSKVHGANVGAIWGRQDPGGPHAGPMNFVIWVFVANEEPRCMW